MTNQPDQPTDSQAELQILIRRGVILLQRGRHQEALDPLQQAHDLDPDNFDAALNLSAAHILGKRFKKAVPLLEALVKRDADNAMLWTNLGAAYLGNPVLADDERQLKAVAAFVRALQADPNAPNVAYNIGLIHKDRKEYEVAKQWFEIALRSNRDDQDAQVWLDEIAALDADDKKDNKK